MRRWRRRWKLATVKVTGRKVVAARLLIPAVNQQTLPLEPVVAAAAAAGRNQCAAKPLSVQPKTGMMSTEI